MVLSPIGNIYAMTPLWMSYLLTVITDKSPVALSMAQITLPLHSGNAIYATKLSKFLRNISSFSTCRPYKY